jgi:hypothetical protein
MRHQGKGHRKPFGEVLASRINAAALSDTEVSKRAGISKALLSQLKSGEMTPSLKVIPSLAWALCSTPSALYDDTCSLFHEAGLGQPSQPFAQILTKAHKSLWIVIPAHYKLPDSAVEALFSFVREKRQIEVRVFTTLEIARLFWNDSTWDKFENFCVKTPSEFVLSLDYPIVVVDSENTISSKIFRGILGFSDFLLVDMGHSSYSSYLSKQLALENHYLNVVELAGLEVRQPDNSLVILYTTYFPEEGRDDEGQRLYTTVRENLRRNIRYLYLVPTLDKFAAEEVHIAYNAIKNRLKVDQVIVSNNQYRMIQIDSGSLYREGTFILYANAGSDGQPEPNILLKQVPDTTPIRFARETRSALSKFNITLMHPLKDEHKGIEDWLLGKESERSE